MGRNARMRRERKQMSRLEVIGAEPPAEEPQLLGQVLAALVRNPDGSVGVAIQHNFDNPIMVLGVLEAAKAALQGPQQPQVASPKLVLARGNVPRS